jgi:hypothetical protein
MRRSVDNESRTRIAPLGEIDVASEIAAARRRRNAEYVGHWRALRQFVRKRVEALVADLRALRHWALRP